MEVWRLEESELQNALFTPSQDYMIVAAARICTCKFGKDCLPTHLTYALPMPPGKMITFYFQSRLLDFRRCAMTTFMRKRLRVNTKAHFQPSDRTRSRHTQIQRIYRIFVLFGSKCATSCIILHSAGSLARSGHSCTLPFKGPSQ